MKFLGALYLTAICAAEEEGIKFSEPNKKLQRLDRMDERQNLMGEINSEMIGGRSWGSSEQMPGRWDSMYPDYYRGSMGGSMGGRMPPPPPSGLRGGESSMMSKWREDGGSSYSGDFQSVHEPRHDHKGGKPVRDFAGMGGPGGPGGPGGMGGMGGGMGGGPGGMGGGPGGMGGGRGFMGLGDPLNPLNPLHSVAEAAAVGSAIVNDPLLKPVVPVVPVVPGRGFLSAEQPSPASTTSGSEEKVLEDDIQIRNYYEHGHPVFQFPGSDDMDSYFGASMMPMMDHPRRGGAGGSLPEWRSGAPFDWRASYPYSSEWRSPMEMPGRHSPWESFSRRPMMEEDYGMEGFGRPPFSGEMMPRRSHKMTASPPHHFDSGMMKPF